MTDKHSRILVLATGGTIAGRAADNTTGTYTSGSVSAEDLLISTGTIPLNITLRSEDVAAIGSQDMDTPVWHCLHQRIERAFNLDEADGIIITHGTDTLEETAFVLELTLNVSLPIVIVGAMRPSDAPSADGPRVLLNALLTASSPLSSGRGIIVVSGDTLMDARSSYKAFTTGTEGMLSYPAGPIGKVSPADIQYFTPSFSPYLRGELALPALGSWPRVVIIYASAAMDELSVRAMMNTNPQGVVLAGVGHGNAPAWLLELLSDAAAKGIAVIRSSRINSGSATFNLEVEDSRLGFVAARGLNPQRSRILLQMLLYQGRKEASQLQSVFDAI